MRLNVLSQRKPGSALALAIALACGTAVAAVGFAEPAYAQKKKKKGKEQPYSEEFVSAYNPLNEAVNGEGSDLSGLRPQVEALLAIANTPDERLASGNLAYNLGVKTSDQAVQLTGMEMMLTSSKLAPENVPQYTFVAYQLASVNGDTAKARSYLQKAIDLNFSSDRISADELQVQMAEIYFNESRFQEGLNYLNTAIERRESTGSAAPELWYRRGLQVGYDNELQPQVYEFVAGWVEHYPSESAWRDAINITRNLNQFAPQELLDLMRLAREKGTMINTLDYADFVESADARRLPKEVADIIEAGYAKGHVSQNEIFLADALALAKGRIAADQASLPELESDARAASAGLRTVVAAGDAFLSYSQYGKAEEFYSKALTMPGVESNTVMTRLGIAQAMQDKSSEALATFGEVSGTRLPIAMLWSAYVSETAPASSTAAAPAETPAPEADVAAGG